MTANGFEASVPSHDGRCLIIIREDGRIWEEFISLQGGECGAKSADLNRTEQAWRKNKKGRGFMKKCQSSCSCWRCHC